MANRRRCGIAKKQLAAAEVQLLEAQYLLSGANNAFTAASVGLKEAEMRAEMRVALQSEKQVASADQLEWIKMTNDKVQEEVEAERERVLSSVVNPGDT